MRSRVETAVLPGILLIVLATANACRDGGQAAAHDQQQARNHATPSGGGFTLTDQNGARWSLSDMAGRTALIFFGYTICADACPIAMAKVARAARALGDDAKDLTAVLVSVDPERDTPDVLREYVKGFEFPLVALTGSKTEIDGVARRFDVKYSKEQSSSAAGYLISHTTTLFLVDRTGRVLHLYPSGSQAEQIAADIRHLLRETPR